MIISCHILQFYQIEFAWWLNVGVQIFLCISGYLYGQREIGSVKTFYLRRIRKIGIPFLVLTIVEIAIYFIFAPKHISPVSAARVLLLLKTLYGGEHLWFIPTILFCYALTPVMEMTFRKSQRKHFLITFGLGVLLILWLCEGFTVFHPAWITCYFIGYALGANEKHAFFGQKTILLLFGCLSLQNLLQIYLDICVVFSGAVRLENIIHLWKDYNHVWLGVFLFSGMKWLFTKANLGNCLSRILTITDDYSYECYLVHQFVILGPFTLLQVTNVRVVNIILCLLCIGGLTFLLKKADVMLERRMFKIRRKADIPTINI